MASARSPRKTYQRYNVMPYCASDGRHWFAKIDGEWIEEAGGDEVRKSLVQRVKAARAKRAAKRRKV